MIGDQEVGSASEEVTFKLTHDSAEYWRTWTGRLGVQVAGRDLFDYTNGWQGNHPLGVPVVVLTREPTDWDYPGAENFHFVTGGIVEAIERAQTIAGDKDVAVAAGTIASQALEAGLLDLVAIDLVPVVLGSGWPYFTATVGGTSRLGDPTTVIQAERVTHLVFRVADRS